MSIPYERPRILPKPEMLKPCPFCGGEAFIRVMLRNYMVDAKHEWNCPMAHGIPPVDTHWVTQSAAIAAWNRRAE